MVVSWKDDGCVQLLNPHGRTSSKFARDFKLVTENLVTHFKAYCYCELFTTLFILLSLVAATG